MNITRLNYPKVPMISPAAFSSRLRNSIHRGTRGLVTRFMLLVAAAFVCSLIPNTQAAITGQWGFESGDLAMSAKIGQPIDYLDTFETPFDTAFNTTASFGIANINGQSVPVMYFPMTLPQSQVGGPGAGFTIPHGAAPNGGGFNVNQYTIIMDIYYPASSSGTNRMLLQTDINAPSNPNAEFVVDNQNRIGTDGGFFSGTATVTPGAWHRVAFAVDLTIPSVAKFIDGVKIDESNPGAGVDGRFSLNGAYLYFDNDGNPAHTDTQTAPGYLSSLQFRDERVPDTLIQSLGAPTPGGILTGPPPNPYVTTLLPSPQSAIIPARSTVPPNPLIQAIIVDGTNGVNPALVSLTLDGQSVSPTVNKVMDTTTVSFTPTAFLASLSLHTVRVTYTGLDGTPYNTQWQFVVGFYVAIPAGDPLGSANTPGFLVRTV